MITCIGVTAGNRALLLYEKGLRLGLPDIRGFLADASVSLLAIVLLALLLEKNRWWRKAAGTGLVVVFVLGNVAMYEFMLAFDSIYALSHAEFLADQTFLGGSAKNIAHPALLAVALVCGVAGVWFGSGRRRAWVWAGVVALAITGIAQALVPLSYDHDEWRQRHALYANLLVLPLRAVAGRQGSVSPGVARAFESDLDGKRWLGPLTDKPNIVLIVLEGVSGAYLPTVAAADGVESDIRMPALDALSRANILFSHVVSHQRQTNRGEYALLCGDYPKLVTDQSKMTEQVYGQANRCLPAVLRDAGYFTTYIQSAPLGFMMKDQFMAKAGFDEVLGDPWFTKSYARTDWGVDDKAFFEQAGERLINLHATREPFFATLLTVSTHHPYTFPSSFQPPGAASRQVRAFLWADQALRGLVDTLERAGVLKDTWVVITSDESAGVSSKHSVDRILSQSWSFFVVITPDHMQKLVPTQVAHNELALSIVDLLGVDDAGARFVGRSLFRDYAGKRYLFSGNTYSRRVVMWTPEGQVVLCDEGVASCIRTTPHSGFLLGERHRIRSVSPRDAQHLRDAIRLSKSGLNEATSARTLELLVEREVRIPRSEGKKLIFGGQYLNVPTGSVVRVDLDMEVVGTNAVVDIHQNVRLKGELMFERKGIQLRGGQRWQLRYEFGVPEAGDALVVQFYARTIRGEESLIRFRESTVAIREAEVASTEARVIEDEVAPLIEAPPPH